MPTKRRKPSIPSNKRPSKARKNRKSKPFSFRNFLFKWFLRMGILGTLMGVGFYFWLFHFMPTLNPNNEYSKENILSKLSSETSVYYNDENTFMGSFFANEHRRYIPYEKMPEKIIQAIVAGEDGDFFEHNGFNPKGFARAMLNNLKARRFVAGGSTLSQQTAKNIFGRKGRSVVAKYHELVQALRLEKNFSKEEILEFYLNQFYVTGTGRGVGIASRYFFDKNLKDLSIRQLAFIAGSVKGPHNYDPFIQKTDESYKRAIEKGQHRIEYILSRMKKENFLTKAEYEREMKAQTKFSRGTFRSPLTTGMNQVLITLNSADFEKIWAKHDIDHWQDAHLKIVSTLDPQIQRGTHLALRQNLTRLSLALENFQLPKRKSPSRAQRLTQGEAFYGEVVKEDEKGLHLKAGRYQLIFPVIDLKKFEEYGEKSGNRKTRELFKSKQWKQPGQILRLAAIENARTPAAKPIVKVNVLINAEIQGATAILNQGRWLASVGGFNDKDFDRVHSAKRQLGSSWKIPLYAIALKLGWRLDDLLENKYNLFQFDKQFYFPNPDHKIRGEEVTIQWAGTRSENIASVYLLMHLLDKLDQTKLIEIAQEINVAPQSGESAKSWYKRIRDDWGVILNKNAAYEVVFEKVRRQLEEKKSFNMNFKEADALRNYKYGRGFDKEIKVQSKLKKWKNVLLLEHNFLRDFKFVQKIKENHSKTIFAQDSLDRIGVFINGLTPQHKKDGWVEIPNPLHEDGDSTQMVETLFGDIETLLPEQVEQPELKDFWIDGRIKVSTVESIHQSIKNESITEPVEWFMAEGSFIEHPTIKSQMAMKIFAMFMKQMGMKQKIEEVVSMVLGATSVELSQMIQVYQSITTGVQYQSIQGNGAWVSRVEDSQGNVLYDLEKDIKSQRVLESKIVSQVNMILESIVRNGTGSRANRAIKVKDPKLKLKYHWPVGGKTGTTNGYRNAAFLGNLAGYDSKQRQLSFESGAAIGSYVGFDKNRAMKRGRIKIGGSNGALPMWNDAALELIDHMNWRKKVDYLDLEIQITSRLPLYWGREVTEVLVDKMSGTIVDDPPGAWVHWPTEFVEE